MTLNLIFLLKLVITFKSKRLPILYRALGTNMVMTKPSNITPTPFTNKFVNAENRLTAAGKNYIPIGKRKSQ